MSCDAGFELAQANVAKMRYPLDDPRMAEFVQALDRINGLADNSEGFIWRLQSESGNALDIDAFGDNRILYNSSVWRSVEDVFAYTYESEHADFFRRRSTWFEPTKRSALVLWWVPAGHRPRVEEGRARLRYFWRRGPSAEAFDFRSPFDATGQPFPSSWRRELAPAPSDSPARTK